MAPSLTLYTQNTPNGFKVSIYLELLGLPYDVKAVDFSKKEQKTPAFLKMSPDGKIPVLVDNLHGIIISQTGAILQYLSEVYDKENKVSYPPGTKEHFLETELLFLHASEQSPMLGQLAFFKVFAAEKIPMAINRFETEMKRILSVLESYLERNKSNGPFFVGTHYCTVDAAVITWLLVMGKAGIQVSDYPMLSIWLKTMLAVEAVEKGMSVPTKSSI